MDAKTAYKIAESIPRTGEKIISISVRYKEDGALEHVDVFNHGTEEGGYFKTIKGVTVYIYNVKSESGVLQNDEG